MQVHEDDVESIVEIISPNLTDAELALLEASESRAVLGRNALRILIRHRKNEFTPLWMAYEVIDRAYHKELSKVALSDAGDKRQAVREFASTDLARDHESTKSLMVSCLRWFASLGVTDCGKLAEVIELGRSASDIEERIVAAFHSIEQRIEELDPANCPPVTSHPPAKKNRTEQNMKLKEFFGIVLAGFDAAFSIVHQQDKLTREEILDALRRLDAAKNVKDPGAVWFLWPDHPLTFGGYMRSGPNALSIAQYFTESIWARIQFVKVQEYGMPNLFEMDETTLRSLIAETIKSLDGAVIDFSQWGPIKRFQDADLLRNKIAVEIKEYMAGLTEGDMRMLCEGFDNPILSPPLSSTPIEANSQTEPICEVSREDAIRKLFADIEGGLKELAEPRKRQDADKARNNGTGLPDLGFYSTTNGWVAYQKSGENRSAKLKWLAIAKSDMPKVKKFFESKPLKK